MTPPADTPDATTTGDLVVVDHPADGVTRLTLNRPDRLNTLTVDLVAAMHEALDAVDADHDCRVVILTGAGRGFCAGLDLNGYGTVPGTDSEGAATFAEMGAAAGFEPSSSYTGESYDAAALIMLSMEAAGSADSSEAKMKVMDIANAPGVQIFPGELGKALELIRAGEDIDYVGATAVELIGPGESAGNFREYDITDGEITTTKFR